MSVTLAFDVYGTLIDTQGVVSKLQQFIGSRAGDFSRIWREKQLEYSFRRGLMQHYADFSVCTSNALDYTCLFLDISLSNEQKYQLLACYKSLPAFDDVKDGLMRLKNDNFKLYAFSNGNAQAVDMLLNEAGIREYFIGIVSVDDLKTFKPNPAVYQHFLSEAGTTGTCAWLVSSNPFDVIGAISSGMRAAWVQRSDKAVFDPWGIEPTITVPNLCQINDDINQYLAFEGS